MTVEDFPWQEFLEVRRRTIVWFRRWGNDGEPMTFEQVAATLSMDDVEQVKLIYMSFEE
jgi:hypothetical protein